MSPAPVGLHDRIDNQPCHMFVDKKIVLRHEDSGALFKVVDRHDHPVTSFDDIYKSVTINL